MPVSRMVTDVASRKTGLLLGPLPTVRAGALTNHSPKAWTSVVLSATYEMGPSCLLSSMPPIVISPPPPGCPAAPETAGVEEEGYDGAGQLARGVELPEEGRGRHVGARRVAGRRREVG